MMYNLLDLEVAQERYNDLRRESDQERLVRLVELRKRMVARNALQPVVAVVQRVGNRMVAMPDKISRLLRPRRPVELG